MPFERKLLRSSARLAAGLILVAAAISCHEPNYRTEVIANQQGGAEIRKVPKDEPRSVAPSMFPAQPATQSAESIDRQIEILQGKVQELNAQIERLKNLKAASKE